MVTTLAVILTIGVSYLAWKRPGMQDGLCHFPYQESHKNEHFRLLTAGFLHGSMTHLIVNMFVLYQFGSFVEQYFKYKNGDTGGLLMFAFFYLSAIVVANLGTYFKHRDNPGFRSVGASGVTSALVFIYCLFDPWQMFLWPPVPAIVLFVGYIYYSSWATKNSRDNVDHQAHLWGAIFGVAFIMVTDMGLILSFLNKLINPPFL